MYVKERLKFLVVFSVVLILLTLPLISACNGEEEDEAQLEASESDIVANAVEAYLADKAGNTKASDLSLAIAEGNAPYIVSIRSASHYAAGHIPGAVNIAFGDWDALPEDEEILVYCYTGQSASMAAALLGVMDYDVQNLLHGMSGWSADQNVYVTRFDAATHQGNYTVETTANTASGSYDYPELDNTSSSDEDDIIEAAAKTVTTKYISAGDLNMKIAEDEDMTIISLRSADHYAAGHITGAINISLGSLADNLEKIDPDSPVYVYCYTGHSAAQGTALLNILGYDAYSLTFGMCSWSSDATVNAGKCYDASTAQDYEVEK